MEGGGGGGTKVCSVLEWCLTIFIEISDEWLLQVIAVKVIKFISLKTHFEKKR